MGLRKDDKNRLKLRDFIIRTFLPVSIGATLFVGYFFMADRLEPRGDIELCEVFYLTDSDYLIGLTILIGLGIFYRLTIGNRLTNNIKVNELPGRALSVVGFTMYFTSIVIALGLVNGKLNAWQESVLFGFLLGVTFEILSWAFDKLIEAKMDGLKD